MILRTMLKLFIPLLAVCFVSSAQAGLFGGKAELLKEDNISKLKRQGVKHIIVPYFKVNILTKLNKTAKAKSGLFGGGNASAKAAMFTDWTDPDTKVLQQVADDAWKAFEKQLGAAGFDVVPPSKLTASEAFKKLNGSTEPFKDEKFISLVPTGLKRYDPAAKIDPNGSFFLGLSNANSKLEADIAQELLGSTDEVAVVRVTLNLAYGDFDTDASATTAMGSSDRDTASAKVGFVPVLTIAPRSPTMTPEYTGIQIEFDFDSMKTPSGDMWNMATGHARVWMEDTALHGEDVVSQLEEITTGGEKAAAGAVALFGALMGQGASMEAGKYVAKVDGRAFIAESKAEVGKLAELIGQKIAAK